MHSLAPWSPRISVIVSLYKASAYLQARLENFVAQSIFTDCEFLLLDAASPENEQAIAAPFVAQHPQIRYTRLATRESIYAVWNRGIREAQAPYVCNANADDLLRPDALERLTDYLDSHPDCDLVYSDYFVTHRPAASFHNHFRSGYATRPDFSPDVMLYGCFMGPMPLWRKDMHARYGLFDDSLSTAGDWEFWCRAVACGAKFAHLPEFLGLYLHNPVGACNRNIPHAERESRQVRERFRGLLPPTRQVPRYSDFYAWDSRDRDDDFVNICVVTYNRLDYTRQCLPSILERTRYPYRLTVVDNGSSDGTPAYLSDLALQGIIHNLFLLPANIGVAKAANIAWHAEPNARATLKLDNDIVIKKDDWLSDMMAVLENVPSIGLLAYNVEPVSYPLHEENGYRIRIKPKANVGGATVLVPRGTCELLGYWSEELGLYGEEDADYGARVRLSGLHNAYMEDEDALFHLPAGKAAVIANDSLAARDGLEEDNDRDYRHWKDAERRKNLDDPRSAFHRNLAGYQAGWMPLYKSGMHGWLFHQATPFGNLARTLVIPVDGKRPGWFATARLASEHAHQSLRIIVVASSALRDPDFSRAGDLPGVELLMGETSDRHRLLQLGAQSVTTPWCLVVEPGLATCPGFDQELVLAATVKSVPRIQGSVWKESQCIAQPRPWPWLFACKTDLLQRMVTGSAVYMAFHTPANVLPGIEWN